MIGGEHYFTPQPKSDASLGAMLESKLGNISFFSTGRDALFSLLASLPYENILLPDLVCESVYQACTAAGKNVRTYPIGVNLLDFNHLNIEEIETSCLLVMHYFGITNEPLLHYAKTAGVTVISDVTHMFFNPAQLELIANLSDYTIASLRKSGAFPDGGILSSRSKKLAQATSPMREEFFSLRAAGLISRGFSAREGFGNDENFKLLKKAENLIDHSEPGPYQASYLSKCLLFTLDVEAAAVQINLNMQTLAEGLMGSGALPCQPGFASPYFCCVYRDLSEREIVRNNLAAARYFCPVHWDTSRLPTPSPLSERCLSVPCDARYNQSDMQAIANVINTCLETQRLRS